jgi:hypothetical protein
VKWQLSSLSEIFIANSALKGFLPSVCPSVLNQVLLQSEFTVTDFAFKLFSATIVYRFHMATESILCGKCASTLIYITFEDCFSNLIWSLLLENSKLYFLLWFRLSSTLLRHHLYIFDRWRCYNWISVMFFSHRLCISWKFHFRHIFNHESIHLIFDNLSLN